MRSPLALILTIGLATSACGGSSNNEVTVGTGTEDADPAISQGDGPRPATTTASTTSASASVNPQPDFVLNVLDRLDQDWRLESGHWQSSAFDPPLAFETQDDWILLAQSSEAIVLAEPNATADARLSILSPLAVGGDDNIPIAPPDAENFETYLRALESIEIDSVQHLERNDGVAVVVADLLVREPEGHTPFWCSIGTNCLWIMKTAAGEDIHVLKGAPTRIVATWINGVPIRIVASASDPDTFDRLAARATRIAQSLSTTSDPAPTRSHTLLSMLSTRDRSIPEGTYVARVGDQVVEFEIETALEGVAVNHVGSHTIMFDIESAGTFAVAQPTAVVDPDAPQTSDTPTTDQLLELPRDPNEYEEWLSEILVVSDRTTTTIAGMTATTWNVGIDDSLDHYTCPAWRITSAGERCVNTLTSELGVWTFGESDDGYNYLIGDTGIDISAYLDNPNRSTEFEQRTDQLLQSIRILESQPIDLPVIWVPLPR